MTALAAAVPALLLLAVPAAVVLGAGGGLALASGLSRLPLVASDGRLGTVSAAFYATAYVGFGFPLLLASLSLASPSPCGWPARPALPRPSLSSRPGHGCDRSWRSRDLLEQVPMLP